MEGNSEKTSTPQTADIKSENAKNNSENKSSDKKEYSMEEIAKHTTTEDLWVAIHGKVYNVSPFLDDHPGGPEILKENAGLDVTEEFEEVYHSESARKMLDDLLVGHLEGYDPVKAAELRNSSQAGSMKNLVMCGIAVGIAVLAYAAKTYGSN